MNGVTINLPTHQNAAPQSELAPPLFASHYVRNEIRFHTFFLGMAVVVLLISAMMSSRGETGVYLPGFNSPMPPTCASRQLFNIDCPGCGMTRAFISISHGQFARAWHFNPASFLVYLFVAAQIPWHAIQIWRLRSNQRPIYWTWIYFTPIMILVAMLINWGWKLCS